MYGKLTKHSIFRRIHICVISYLTYSGGKTTIHTLQAVNYCVWYLFIRDLSTRICYDLAFLSTSHIFWIKFSYTALSHVFIPYFWFIQHRIKQITVSYWLKKLHCTFLISSPQPSKDKNVILWGCSMFKPELLICKKSLKIPKGQSESVYWRRTDNTMAKRKSTKGQTTINKTFI